MPVQYTILKDQPSHRYRTTIDGVEHFLRLTYRDRQQAWFFDLFDADGEPLVYGRRLSPGFFPMLGHGGGPRGVFYVDNGPRLVYFAEDEVPDAAVSDELNVVLL